MTTAPTPSARRRVLGALVSTVLLVGCGSGTGPGAGPGADRPGDPTSLATGRAASTPATDPTPASPVAPSPTTPGTDEPGTAPAEPRPGRERWVRGIDASHHQGAIDWERVAGDDVGFAYLKASEGSTFTDPRFVDNVAGASRAGLRVGGYHYFSLCSPGAPQGEHLVETLGAAGRTTLPPAVDLELQGQCATPPARADLLAEVRAFLDVVEAATGRRVVVYAFPDLEEEYRLADELGRRQWVRRLGDLPPARDWWIWQRADDATVAGVDGPTDLNLMRP
ncbi:GH25 family lysozyme [Nocardioides dongxiaopingii]|uniref:GH25 family lysozyme n=1 Tax=Nocardioides dongxiaopingii TaxID=2576036 RepID=UPI0014858A7F|nr:GH25 family lysozyme [Nocardioides dongxiaopingii]